MPPVIIYSRFTCEIERMNVFWMFPSRALKRICLFQVRVIEPLLADDNTSVENGVDRILLAGGGRDRSGNYKSICQQYSFLHVSLRRGWERVQNGLCLDERNVFVCDKQREISPLHCWLLARDKWSTVV